MNNRLNEIKQLRLVIKNSIYHMSSNGLNNKLILNGLIRNFPNPMFTQDQIYIWLSGIVQILSDKVIFKRFFHLFFSCSDKLACNFKFFSDVPI